MERRSAQLVTAKATSVPPIAIAIIIVVIVIVVTVGVPWIEPVAEATTATKASMATVVETARKVTITMTASATHMPATHVRSRRR
jgi:hypothetical protein